MGVIQTTSKSWDDPPRRSQESPSSQEPPPTFGPPKISMEKMQVLSPKNMGYNP